MFKILPTRYVVENKLGPINVVRTEEEAKQRSDAVYKGFYYSVGLIEARKVRKEIDDNILTFNNNLNKLNLELTL